MKSIKLLMQLLLLPGFLEAIDFDKFSVHVGLPLTLGRFAFILAGIISFLATTRLKGQLNLILPFILMLVSLFFGAIVSEGPLGVTLFRTFAFNSLYISSYFVGIWMFQNRIDRFLTLFFIINFLYWGYHIFDISFLRGGYNSYSTLFAQKEAANHHVSALAVSVSAFYIFFWQRSLKINKNLHYLIIIISILLCILSESRSNTLITIFGLLIYMKTLRLKRIIIAFIILAVVAFEFFNYFESINADKLIKRFDLNEVEYQNRTTESRIDMIHEATSSLLNNPFGKGLNDLNVMVSGRSMLVHNQFLTFVIAGGWLALIANIILLTYLYKSIITILRNKQYNNWFLYSLGFCTLIFNLTLLTVENTGMFFFIMLALLVSFLKLTNSSFHN